jgi:heme-degrading monooxygenase HmoA
VILSCLTIDLRPGTLGALEDVFRRHRILERASEVEGCRSLFLTADVAHDGRAHVVGVWEDEAAYQRWLDHPERGVGGDEIHALVAASWDQSAPGEVWRVLHTALRTMQPTGSLPAR